MKLINKEYFSIDTTRFFFYYTLVNNFSMRRINNNLHKHETHDTKMMLCNEFTKITLLYSLFERNCGNYRFFTLSQTILSTKARLINKVDKVFVSHSISSYKNVPLSLSFVNILQQNCSNVKLNWKFVLSELLKYFYNVRWVHG